MTASHRKNPTSTTAGGIYNAAARGYYDRSGPDNNAEPDDTDDLFADPLNIRARLQQGSQNQGSSKNQSQQRSQQGGLGGLGLEDSLTDYKETVRKNEEHQNKYHGGGSLIGSNRNLVSQLTQGARVQSSRDLKEGPGNGNSQSIKKEKPFSFEVEKQKRKEEEEAQAQQSMINSNNSNSESMTISKTQNGSDGPSGILSYLTD